MSIRDGLPYVVRKIDAVLRSSEQATEKLVEMFHWDYYFTGSIPE